MSTFYSYVNVLFLCLQHNKEISACIKHTKQIICEYVGMKKAMNIAGIARNMPKAETSGSAVRPMEGTARRRLARSAPHATPSTPLKHVTTPNTSAILEMQQVQNTCDKSFKRVFEIRKESAPVPSDFSRAATSGAFRIKSAKVIVWSPI